MTIKHTFVKTCVATMLMVVGSMTGMGATESPTFSIVFTTEDAYSSGSVANKNLSEFIEEGDEYISDFDATRTYGPEYGGIRIGSTESSGSYGRLNLYWSENMTIDRIVVFASPYKSKADGTPVKRAYLDVNAVRAIEGDAVNTGNVAVTEETEITLEVGGETIGYMYLLGVNQYPVWVSRVDIYVNDSANDDPETPDPDEPENADDPDDPDDPDESDAELTGLYRLVKSDDELEEDVEYLIMGKDGDDNWYVMGRDFGDYRLAPQAAVNGELTPGVTGQYPVSLVRAGDDCWRILTEFDGKQVYICTMASATGYMSATEEATEATLTKITVNDNDSHAADITFQVDTSFSLRFNPSKPCFASYAGKYSDVYLWRRTTPEACIDNEVTFSNSTATVVLALNIDDAGDGFSIYYTTDGTVLTAATATTEGTLYTAEGFTLTDNATVNAIAVINNAVADSNAAAVTSFDVNVESSIVTTYVNTIDVPSPEPEAVYYTLQGQRISRPLPGTPVIYRRGTKAAVGIYR